MPDIRVFTQCSVVGSKHTGVAAVIDDGINRREESTYVGAGNTHQAALQAIAFGLSELTDEERQNHVTVWTQSKYAAAVLDGSSKPIVHLDLIEQIKNLMDRCESAIVVWHEKDAPIFGEEHREKAKELAYGTLKDKKK